MTDTLSTIGFFGPPSMKKDYERHVAAPIGQPCIYCAEPVAEGDIGTIDQSGTVAHHECSFRAVVGSVGHQKRLCSCYGGTEEDDPALTRRQAARAALTYFHKTKAYDPEQPS